MRPRPDIAQLVRKQKGAVLLGRIGTYRSRPSVADGGGSVGGVLLEVFAEHLGELVGLVVVGGGGFPSVAGV